MTESHGKPRRAVDDPEAQPDVSDSAPLTPPPGYDADRIEAAVREFLLGIGEDPDREGLRDTPQRVARACAELFAGLGKEAGPVLATTFDVSHDEMVLVRDIKVQSFCEHHLLPFQGVAHVAYIPPENGRVHGLSKIARLVDVFAQCSGANECFGNHDSRNSCDSDRYLEWTVFVGLPESGDHA